MRALQDVSLEIGDGERVGLIFHNGAGKTTLLRVFAGIYRPPIGHIEVAGRLSSLFTAGFILNVDDTGLENIMLGSMLLEIPKNELEQTVADIASFSQLGEYLHLPIRTYSSGMVMRLAFAIATSVQADILLLDEWLSTGDAQFWQRARARMDQVLQRSKIMVLASHDLALLESTCNRGILLREGRVVEDGPIRKVIAAYQGLAST